MLKPTTRNRYALAGGNPIGYVEFSGHDPLDEEWRNWFTREYGHAPDYLDVSAKLYQLAYRRPPSAVRAVILVILAVVLTAVATAAAALVWYVWGQGPGQSETSQMAMAASRRVHLGMPVAEAVPLLARDAIRRRRCVDDRGVAWAHVFYYGNRILEKSAAVRLLAYGSPGEEVITHVGILSDLQITLFQECPEVTVSHGL